MTAPLRRRRPPPPSPRRSLPARAPGSKATAAVRPAWSEVVGDDRGRDRRRLGCVLGREQDVGVVRKQDHLARRARRDRREHLGGRGVHRPAAVDDPGARGSRTACWFPAPAATATRPQRGSSAAGTACRRRRSRSRVCTCMSAISTLAIDPRATPSESARPGSSVWTWTFSAVGSPTTSSESPSGSSARSSSSASSRSPSTTNAVQ